MDHEAEQGPSGQAVRRDGLAAVAMVVLTIVLIAFVVRSLL